MQGLLLFGSTVFFLLLFFEAIDFDFVVDDFLADAVLEAVVFFSTTLAVTGLFAICLAEGEVCAYPPVKIIATMYVSNNRIGIKIQKIFFMLLKITPLHLFKDRKQFSALSWFN